MSEDNFKDISYKEKLANRKVKTFKSDDEAQEAIKKFRDKMTKESDKLGICFAAAIAAEVDSGDKEGISITECAHINGSNVGLPISVSTCLARISDKIRDSLTEQIKEQMKEDGIDIEAMFKTDDSLLDKFKNIFS